MASPFKATVKQSGNWPKRFRSIAVFAVIGTILGYSIKRLIKDRATLSSLSIWKHPLLLALHLILTLLTFAGLTVGWHFSLRATGCKPSFMQSSNAWLAANLGKYAPGNILMIAGRVAISKRIGIRPAAAATAMGIEHLMMVLGSLPFLVAATLWGLKSSLTVTSIAVTAVLFPSIAIFARPIMLKQAMDGVLTRMGRESLAFAPDRASLARLLLIYMATWIAYGFSGVAIVRAAGILSLPVHDTMAVWVGAWAIGFLSLLTPGGIGVREAALVALISMAIPTAQAIALALFARATWTAIELLGVLVGFAIGSRVAHNHHSSGNPEPAVHG